MGKIHVVTKGSGENILILHGWGATTKSWGKVQDDLVERGYKVVVPDMPGFGESEAPPKPWTSEDYLKWLLDFIKAEQIPTPVIIVGHSFGGSLAAKLAIEHPSLVKKLVLVSAARTGAGKTSLKVNIIKSLSKIGGPASRLPFYKTARKAFYKFVVRSRDYERAEGVMRQTMQLVLKENLTPLLHKIEAPTLIIWGDKDKATPIDNAYTINREIKGSKLHVIPGAPHAINLYHPHELAELIYNFAKSV